MEKRIKELESCQNEVMKVKEEMTELKREVEEYKRQVAIYEMAEKSRKKTKVRDEATKTMIQEAHSVFALKVGRYVKFPGPGWKLLSKESNTVCGMMLPEILFSAGSSDGEENVMGGCIGALAKPYVDRSQEQSHPANEKAVHR